MHPDGRVSQQTEIFEPAHLIETLPLRTGTTPAVRFGQVLEWLMVAAGVALMIAAAVSARQRGRGYAPTGEQQRKPEEN